MKSYVISAWLVLLSTIACLQKVNGAFTPLMSAVNKNDVDLVKRLLDNGVDDLYLISEKSIWKNSVRVTGFLLPV